MKGTFAVLIAAVAAGCSRSEAPRASGASGVEGGVASAPAPAVSSMPASSAQRAPVAEVRLQARKADHKGKAEVWLIAQQLGLESRVTEVSMPFVCRLTPTQQGAEVTCTPNARVKRATIEQQEGRVRVSAPGAKTVDLPIPSGTTLAFQASEASPRDLPDGACAADAGTRELDVGFLYHNDMETGGTMRVVIPRERAGDVHVMELWHQGRGLGMCRSGGTVRERRLQCSDIKDTCVIRAEEGTIAFACEGPSAQQGRVLLPCGGQAKLVTSGPMSRGESYH